MFQFLALVLSAVAAQAAAQPREVAVAVYGKDDSTVPRLQGDVSSARSRR